MTHTRCYFAHIHRRLAGLPTTRVGQSSSCIWISTTCIFILQVSCSNKSECSDLSCFPHNSQHCLICDSQEIYAKKHTINCCKKLHMKMMMITGALMRRLLAPWLQTFTTDECTDRKLLYINTPNKNPPTGVLTKSTNVIHAERYFVCPGWCW